MLDSGKPSSVATPCRSASASAPVRPPDAAKSAGVMPEKTMATTTKTAPGVETFAGGGCADIVAESEAEDVDEASADAEADIIAVADAESDGAAAGSFDTAEAVAEELAEPVTERRGDALCGLDAAAELLAEPEAGALAAAALEPLEAAVAEASTDAKAEMVDRIEAVTLRLTLAVVD